MEMRGKSMKFKCIVVLYNVNYKDSVSYMDLVQTDVYKENRLEIICVDNSVCNFGNEELKLNYNHHYISMNGNKGLSKAYNSSINYLKKNNEENSLVVLLDDDTHIGNDYFEKMEKASEDGCDIYLPIVQDQLGILSPSIMRKYRCRRCKRLEQVNEHNICGINSGMAIRESVFKKYQYDEQIFLDYVDHSFMRDMRRGKKKICVVDTVLYQDFSSITDSYEQTMTRFQIFKNDINVFYSGSLVDRIVYFYIILRRKFGIAIKFRKIETIWK